MIVMKFGGTSVESSAAIERVASIVRARAERKPIACRVFPFRFHPIEGDLVVTSSFACPTVVANEGAPLPAQARDISRLYVTWKSEYPESPAPVEFVAGYRLPSDVTPRLRSMLIRILDTPDADGAFDLAVSLRRCELGLRLALGAMRAQIPRHFLAQGARVAMVGCIAGLALSAACARLVSGMLYGSARRMPRRSPLSWGAAGGSRVAARHQPACAPRRVSGRPRT